MRILSVITMLSLTLLFAGCSGPKEEPVSFYLSSQKLTSGSATIPTNPPVLVVTRLTFVAADAEQHTITIKFLPADASAIQKLTTENIGGTVVIVQRSNVISAAVVSAPVPPDAGLMFPVNTNLDFESVYRAISRLE
jgi:hypothetical protein